MPNEKKPSGSPLPTGRSMIRVWSNCRRPSMLTAWTFSPRRRRNLAGSYGRGRVPSWDPRSERKGGMPGAHSEARHDLVVIGASAGGVEALKTLVACLPRDLHASVVAVLHLPAGGTSVLPSILDRAGPLPARPAGDGEPLEPGTIYVAVPDCHVQI